MLALIAGQGRLPTRLAEAAKPSLVLALEGFPPDTLVPDRAFRIEALGTVIADLVARGVTRLCLAGAIRRPPLDPTRIDAATLPLVPRMMTALQAGDDAALRLVLAFFEEAGIDIVPAHMLLPGLLPEEGCPSMAKPDPQQDADTAKGYQILGQMSPLDIGQSCVVHRGQVLTLEGSYGTDWMLETLTSRPTGENRGGVLVKAPKAGQDRRVDMPTIGPDTVARAVTAGLDGIAVAAGGVYVLDLPEVIRAADEAGLFFQVRAT